MNRMNEDAYPTARPDRDEDGWFPKQDASFSVAVNYCENCNATCETLVHVAGYDYMGCQVCADEASVIMLEEMLNAAGCTPDEIGAWNRMTPERAVAELKREVA